MGSSVVARRVGSSALVLGSRSILLSLISAVGTALIARLLGPSEFGGLAAGLAVFTVALSVSDLGFSLTLGRELGAGQASPERLLRAVFQVQGGWSVLLAIMMLGLAWLTGLSTPRGQVIAVLAPALAVSGFAGARQLFIVRFQVRRLAFIDLSVNGLQVACMVALAAIGAGAVGVAAAVAGGTIILSVIVLAMALKEIGYARPTAVDRRTLIRRALPFGVSSLLASLYFSIDLVFIGWLVSAEQLGQYAAAVKFLSVLVSLPGLIMTVALPGLAAESSDPSALGTLAARVSHWTASLFLPICVGLAVFAATVVTLAFGPRYHDAIGLVRILSIAAAVACLCNVLGTLQVTLGLARSQLLAGIIALTINVAGNVVLDPVYGVTAAAWLTAGGEVLVAAWALLSLRGKVSVKPALRQIARPMPALGAFAFAGMALSAWPAVAIPVSVVALLAGMSLTKAWPEEFFRVRSSQVRQ